MSTLAVVPRIGIELERFSARVQNSYANYAKVHWLLICDNEVLKSRKTRLKVFAVPIQLYLLGVYNYEVSNALIQYDSPRRRIFRTGTNFSLAAHLAELLPCKRSRSHDFSGTEVRLGCLYFAHFRKKTYINNPSMCNRVKFRWMISILREKNVSLSFHYFLKSSDALTALADGRIDVIVSPAGFEGNLLHAPSYAVADAEYDTFYARVNDTRAISIFDVVAFSALALALTLGCLFLCAVVLASPLAQQTADAFCTNLARETAFLLAALRATSASEYRSNGRIARFGGCSTLAGFWPSCLCLSSSGARVQLWSQQLSLLTTWTHWLNLKMLWMRAR